jgi:hypothetical protein
MRLFIALGVAAMGVVWSSVDLSACGDKYLRLAARLGPAYRAEHRATVLIYMPAGSATTEVARSLRLHDALRRARHDVFSVDTEADLERTLATRRYHIVIADGSMAAALKTKLVSGANAPTLLPIFRTTSDRQALERRAQIGCLIASSERQYHAVAEIDHVMELRKATALS